nr:WSSV072 [White spot syndrome virus]QHB92511.1 hypothetical protein [White spot syndrome virus]QVW09655.1 MAG: hypothetical protein KOBFAEHK_00040 [White spot syndrome virus]QVW09842.1 MAG: hypothetical protein OJPGDAPP_00074 [White spot syndrome virus]WCQ76677.1 hypothetical protein WSSU-DNA_00087 [White spot syndrome virus]
MAGIGRRDNRPVLHLDIDPNKEIPYNVPPTPIICEKNPFVFNMQKCSDCAPFPPYPGTEKPFPPYPGTAVEEEEKQKEIEELLVDQSFPPPFPGNKLRDIPRTYPLEFPEKKEKDFPCVDTTGHSDIPFIDLEKTPPRSDVRHGYHYLINPNKVGELNHIVGKLTEKQENLNKLVLDVDDVVINLSSTLKELEKLRAGLCKFSKN